MMETYIKRLESAVRGFDALMLDYRFVAVAESERLLAFEADLRKRYPDLAAKLSKLIESYAAYLLHELTPGFAENKTIRSGLEVSAVRLFREWLDGSGVRGLVKWDAEQGCATIYEFSACEGTFSNLPVTEYYLKDKGITECENCFYGTDRYRFILTKVLAFYLDAGAPAAVTELFRIRGENSAKAADSYNGDIKRLAAKLSELSSKLSEAVETGFPAEDFPKFSAGFGDIFSYAHDISSNIKTAKNTASDEKLRGIFDSFCNFIKKEDDVQRQEKQDEG